MVRVAVDAMGGDNAPGEIVKGCLLALQKSEAVKILLCGKEEILRQLVGQQYPAERLEIVPASEVIETGDVPVVSVRKKKDSSLVVGMKLIRPAIPAQSWSADRCWSADCRAWSARRLPPSFRPRTAA